MSALSIPPPCACVPLQTTPTIDYNRRSAGSGYNGRGTIDHDRRALSNNTLNLFETTVGMCLKLGIVAQYRI
jgi:hypothetical protein